MCSDWTIEIKMTRFKEDLKNNKELLTDIAQKISEMTAFGPGEVDESNLENGCVVVTMEAKIQSNLEEYWDSIFEELTQMKGSVGIYASSPDAIIVWRYMNGTCTYCCENSDVLIDISKGIATEEQFLKYIKNLRECNDALYKEISSLKAENEKLKNQ